jgi:hypothetical protein
MAYAIDGRGTTKEGGGGLRGKSRQESYDVDRASLCRSKMAQGGQER